MKTPVDRLMLGQARAEVTELREQLAAANALLGRARKGLSQSNLTGSLAEDIDAHLAAQPATAPARTVERLPPRHIPESELVPIDAQPAAAPECCGWSRFGVECPVHGADPGWPGR